MKTLIFDIESTNLNANFGVILCISYKWAGTKKVHTISITDFPEFKNDPTNDKRVVAEFLKVYKEADAVVAHYGEKFDRPMIQTKLLMHSRSIMPNTRLIDTWRIAKTKLKLNSNRLDTLISALDIPHKKTPLSGPTWVRAMAGDRKAIKYVVEHCEADVRALDAVYEKLAPLMTETLPKFHGCKNPDYRHNGLRTCNNKVYERLMCVSCGGWFKGKVQKDV